MAPAGLFLVLKPRVLTICHLRSCGTSAGSYTRRLGATQTRTRRIAIFVANLLADRSRGSFSEAFESKWNLAALSGRVSDVTLRRLPTWGLQRLGHTGGVWRSGWTASTSGPSGGSDGVGGATTAVPEQTQRP